MSLRLEIILRIESYSNWWKPKTQSPSWFGGLSFVMATLCLHSSFHIASSSTQRLIPGSWSRYCWPGSRKLSLEKPTFAIRKAPCHTSNRSQFYLWKNFCDHITTYIWRLNCTDRNPLVCFYGVDFIDRLPAKKPLRSTKDEVRVNIT